MVSQEFFNRMGSYPLVSSARQSASAGIAWATERSGAARAAASLAEGGLRRVSNGAGPLIGRFEARLSDLDKLACRQLLDRLETACPAVLKPTEEVVESGRGYYSENLKPKVDFVLSPVTAAVAKAQATKSAGLKRYRQAVASRQGQAGLRQFDHLIQLLGDCLDKCLPPAVGEADKDEQEKKKIEGQAEEEEDEDETGVDEDEEDEDKDAGKVQKKDGDKNDEAADPLRSLSLAYDLGCKVSFRVSDRVTDGAGRLTAVGHRLVDRLIGRSPSSTAETATSEKPSTNQEAPPAESDDEADESLDLDRTDMSTD